MEKSRAVIRRIARIWSIASIGFTFGRFLRGVGVGNHCREEERKGTITTLLA